MTSTGLTTTATHATPALFNADASNELIAGIVAGTFGIVPFHPIDTLKSRMQTRALESSSSSFQMLRTMIAKEGALSLYRGVASPMIGLLDYNARVNRGPLTFAQECLVGASAGFFSSFIRCPVERVKTYMQVRNSNKYLAPYRSSLKCGVALVKKHGVRTGLYAGLSATILREIPQYITYFLGYDYATKFLKSTNGLGVIPDRLTPAIAGGLAGSMVWVPPFYTIDVIKTRLQSAPTGTYSGFLDCCTKSVQAEGWGVMVKGMYLAQARAFLVHGSIFFLYEHVLEGVLQFRDKDDMETKVYHLS